MTRPEAFSPEALHHILAPLKAPKLWVACSGGLDSMTLLHALATRRDLFPMPIGAIHVNHRWHADSWKMESRVRESSMQWGVPLVALAIDRPISPPEGLEAASRDLRYTALARLLAPGEVLLTAHHANDQLETLLLALLRGSGLRGLRGMAHGPSPFGAGRLMRPLLGFSRDTLSHYASAAGVPWLEDPTNQDESHARNYLRHSVVPKLEGRWPVASRSFDVSARFLEESLAFQDERLDQEMREAWNARWDGLRIDKLRAMPEPELRLLLRHWLNRSTSGKYLAPSRAQMESLIEVIQREPKSRHASFVFQDQTVALHADHLFAVRRLPRAETGSHVVTWEPGSMQWRLWPGWGILRLVPGSPRHVHGFDAAAWRVTLRSGGERMVCRPQGGHSALKEIFRSQAVPPWLRNRIPLVFAGEELVAVGEWFWNPDWFAGQRDPGMKPLAWEPEEPDLLHEKQRYDRFIAPSRATMAAPGAGAA